MHLAGCMCMCVCVHAHACTCAHVAHTCVHSVKKLSLEILFYYSSVMAYDYTISCSAHVKHKFFVLY
jgi:hypothetical protein